MYCRYTGKKEDLKPLDKEDDLHTFAEMHGLHAFAVGDGRMVVEFPGVGMGTYADREHAFASLQAYYNTKSENAAIGNAIKQAAAGKFPETGSGPASVAELEPNFGAAMRSRPRPEIEDLTNYTTGHHSWESVERVMAKGSGVMNKVKLGALEHLRNFNFVVPESTLRAMGKWGNVLADLYKGKNDLKNNMQGWAHATLQSILKPLNKLERESALHDYMENGISYDPTRTAIMQSVGEKLQAMQEMYFSHAEKIGLDTAERQEVYKWPRRYDLGKIGDEHAHARELHAAMANGLADSPEEAEKVLETLGFGGPRYKITKKVIESIMEKSPKTTPEQAMSQAEIIIDNFIRGHGARFASSLEKNRTLPGDDNYIKHVRGWDITFQDNARRLAEAYYFGPRDEKLTEAMGQILKEGATPTQKLFINDVYAHETGRARSDVSGFMRSLMAWNRVKLSLSWLQNLTGNLNTMTRVGPKAFFGGGTDYWRALREKGKVGVKENLYGSGSLGGVPNVWDHPAVQGTVNDALREITDNGYSNIFRAETFAKAGATMREAVANGLSTPFNFTEEWVNRGLSYFAGARHFDDTLKNYLASAPGSKARQLMENRFREMGFDVAERGGEKSKFGKWAEAFQRGEDFAVKDYNEIKQIAAGAIVRDTQFRADLQNLPQFAMSPIGRMVAQFKTYPINQTRFVLRELNLDGHRDPVRFMRALGALAVVYPAVGLALNKAREGLFGDTLTSKYVDKLWRTPGLGPKVLAATVAYTTSGMLGIAADTGMTFAMGNRFQAAGFASPAALSTPFNLINAALSGTKGLMFHNREQTKAGIRAALQEFGGLGSWVIKRTPSIQPRH